MSIGPDVTAPEEIKPSIAQTVKRGTKKIVDAYFTDPIHYLLYGSLAGLLIGLFFNVQFPLALYVLVGVLALIKTIIHFKKYDIGK